MCLLTSTFFLFFSFLFCFAKHILVGSSMFFGVFFCLYFFLFFVCLDQRGIERRSA